MLLSRVNIFKIELAFALCRYQSLTQTLHCEGNILKYLPFRALLETLIKAAYCCIDAGRMILQIYRLDRLTITVHWQHLIFYFLYISLINCCSFCVTDCKYGVTIEIYRSQIHSCTGFSTSMPSGLLFANELCVRNQINKDCDYEIIDILVPLYCYVTSAHRIVSK